MLVKNYESKSIEVKIQKYWDKNKIFKFNNKNKDKIFSVDTPPPTVSGRMHMGHAFSYAQEDFIVRFKRMQGYNVLFPFGTDDNGLATERLVEKLKGVKSNKMERKDFIKLVLKTLNEIRPEFIDGWKNIGMSCDFDLFYTTISEHSQRISQKSFIELYKKGREYRKKAPTFFCPICRTAIAQVEMEDKEFSSKFVDVKFKLGSKDVVISTTRPELLSACVAVFVNPEDKKNKSLVGKELTVPLFNHKVKVLEDKRVDIEKGTGVVMCCTFGDSNDTEWYLAYNLPLKEAIDREGRMTSIAGKYEGLNVREARKQIIEDLKESNLLVGEKDIKHAVNVHERCGNEIEILESEQWFIKYLDLRKQFLKNGKELNWYPKHMQVRLENWIKGLQWDWCISRQRHYGVPFPVWYCQDCSEIILANEKDLPVDPLKDKAPVKKCKCGSSKFIGEKDVLDTWATSALTPQIVREFFVKDKKIYDKIFPMSLRPQSADIINFWLFNTMVKSQLHSNKNPWDDITISGFVFLKGEKMSKSKGNIIEPQEVLDKYSADSLRFWAASSKLGDDLAYHEKDVVTGQKTLNKLWNTFRFVSMHLKDYVHRDLKSKELEDIDRWLLIKLNNLIKVCTENFDKYEYSRVKSEVENFFWNVFCDYYLEIVKDRLYNEDKRGLDSKRSAQYTLYNTFLSVLKMFSPIIPFVTEEIYLNYFSKKEKVNSISLSKWPAEDKKMNDKKIEKMGNSFVDILRKVRAEKSKENKSMKEEIVLELEKKYEKDFNEDMLKDLKAVTSASMINFGNKFDVKFN
ncbi:valine--tRNA ligase [archaeon]|nr:valine--tRNA ligase [archaeon]|tara:strand:+ start:9307 stop:11703 length:2397 start_codon:yes stop_codon:yes gene_type:complete